MPSPFLFELLGFMLGLLAGSFLNVCIVRLPAHQSIVKPRSHCMSCGHTIRWYDNLPILSWLLLRGRCRDCNAKIPWRYPAVELAMGLWLARIPVDIFMRQFQAFYARPRMQLTTISWIHYSVDQTCIAILGFLLIGLIVMDWQTLRLPDAFTLTGIAIGFVLTCVQAALLPTGDGDIVLNTTHQLRLSSPGSGNALGNVFLTGSEAMVMERLCAIIAAASLLLIIRSLYKAIRKRDGMGLGDVKLLAMIAAFLGFYPALLALFVGVIAASIYGISLLARGRAATATRLPLGSFIAAGGLFAALYGPGIVDWYANLLH